MSSPRKRQRGKFSKWILPDLPNKKYKDNREKFRMFNRLSKRPNWFGFYYVSISSLILTLIPLLVPSAKITTLIMILIILGFSISVFLEQIANYHYYYYSKIANEKKWESVSFNIIINRIARTLAMIGWVPTTIALVSSLFFGGSVSSVW